MDTSLAWRVFDLALRPWMASRLRVHVAGLPTGLDPARPVVLCANHESFWDGFLLRHLQRRLLPGASFHAVMLRAELARRPWLALLGGIGVEPGVAAGARAMLRAVGSLRVGRRGVVLAYFPQGRIEPGGFPPPAFRPGIVRVVDAMAPVVVLPVGLRILPGRTARMDAYLSVGDPIAVPGSAQGAAPLGARGLEAAVIEEMHAIRAWVALHGEEAPERWPRFGERLPRAKDPSWISHDVESWASRN